MFRRTVLAAAGLAFALAVPASAMAATPPVWNLNGEYTIPFTCVEGCPSPPDYPYAVTIDTTSSSTGAVTGSGSYITGGGTPTVTITGNVTGSNVSLTLTYDDPALASYNPFVLTGTIDQLGEMSGTAADGAGRTFTWKTTSGHASLFGTFSGFFAPIEMGSDPNLAKAGSSIPVKFSLGMDQGLSIFVDGYPKSTKIVCDGGAPDDDELLAATANASGLSYDPATEQYTYVWKTDKKWSGTCRVLQVQLLGGETYTAEFQFK